PMKLFMDKKLRITGDIMASQKLEFLKKIDPKAAEAAVAAKKGAKAAAPAAATAATSAAPAKADAQAGKIFAALSARLAADKNLGASLGALVQFNVDGKSWVVDGAAGAVREGADAAAKTVLSLSDEDLTALVRGEKSVQSLYQHGGLRVDGNVGPAHQLSFLRGLL
ncbi:MAG TPA: SCP2 sterol-binding domain-containing protein, partial [Pseudomonadota bacterium]|nr:SCP2 sterol-binding domain-containing protein [Pseudomonadota bacterium]